MYKRKGKTRITVPATIWSARPLLEAARVLNERCFSLLAATASNRQMDGGPVFARAELWSRLNAHSIERGAQCPVMLLTLHFDHLEWWQRAIEGGPGPVLLNAPPPIFTAEEVAPLLRAILTEAWGAARTNVFAANLVFGMTPPLAKVLANLTAQSIDRIVNAHATAVRPRYEESRSFWSGLLEAALTEDTEPLSAKWRAL